MSISKSTKPTTRRKVSVSTELQSTVAKFKKISFIVSGLCIVLAIVLCVVLFKKNKPSVATSNNQAGNQATQQILELTQKIRTRDSIEIEYHKHRADSFANLKYNSYNEAIKNVPFYKENEIKFRNVPNSVKRLPDSNKELIRASIKPRY